MPQITSCPECSKKLRVPDDLIGKKVKCPGCTTMFIAEADAEQEEETPAPAPSARTRSESVSSGPKSGSRRRDEEEEEQRPRARRDEEDDRPRRDEDSESRRIRNRRDDEGDRRPPPRRDDDDDRRPRARRDEEDDDDRGPRRRRDYDDDDDYDRRSRRRDYDDEPSPRQEREGLRKVRLGINLAVMAGWTAIASYGIMMIGGGVMLLLGGGMIGSMIGSPGTAAGTARGGFIGMMGGMCIFAMIVGLATLTELVLRLTGYGMCMAVPKSRRNSARTLVIIAFSLACAGVVLNYGGAFANGASANMAFGYTGGGNAVSGLAGLLAFAGYILWMIFLRSVCVELGDDYLAKQVIIVLVAEIVYGVVAAGIFVTVIFFVIGFSISAATPGGIFAAMGSGFMVLLIVGGILMLGGMGMYAWYVMTLQKVRDLVEYRLDRM